MGNCPSCPNTKQQRNSNKLQEQKPLTTFPEHQDESQVVASEHPTVADDSHNQLSVAELSIRTALYGILLLTAGLVLVTDWLVTGTMTEFKYGEGYTITLMVISLGWMAYVGINNWRTIRDRKRNHKKVKEGDLGADHKREPGTRTLIYSLTLFASVSVLLTVFQLVEFVEDKCVTPLAILSSCFKILFIPSQLYLIYRAQHKVTFKPSTLTGIMLIHIIITNIVLYTWTFIKSKEGVLENKSESKSQTPTALPILDIKSNTTQLVINNSTPCHSDAYAAAFPWLYPFFLEFSLTASAMVAEIWVQCANKHKEVVPVLMKESLSAARSTVLAKKVGIFIFIGHIGVIVTMVQKADTNTSVALWYSIRIINFFLIILLSAAGLWMLKDSQRTSHETTELDEILLFIATFGAFALAAFRVFPTIIQLFENDDHHGYAVVVVFTEVLVITGAIVQPTFISKALHSRSSEKSYIHNTVHEGSIALLLAACNSSMWLMNTIDVEGLDHSIYSNNTFNQIDYFPIERYGSSWTLLVLFCFPIVLFYRLHSTLMLYRVSRIHSKTNRTQPRDELEKQLMAFKHHMQELENKKEKLQKIKRKFFNDYKVTNTTEMENNSKAQQMWQEFANEFEEPEDVQ